MGSGKRYIITGGPGFGKTSLIKQLASIGFSAFPEIARDLVQSGHNAPIDDPGNSKNSQFLKTILSQRLKMYYDARINEVNFYDRGLPDSLAYMRLMSTPPPRSLLETITRHPYENKVFLVPPWELIYHTDSIRKETFRKAKLIHSQIVTIYEELGYQLILLPKGNIEERIEMIRSIVR